MANNSVCSAGLLKTLKAETEACHRQLEDDLNRAGYTRTREGLAEMLSRFRSFYAAWEPAADDTGDSLAPGLRTGRQKLPLIDDDVCYLGLQTVERLPVYDAYGLAKWPVMLGSMYVVEGSTLGGQFIARELEQRLGLTGGFGYSYFLGYREATGSRWKEFGKQAEVLAESVPDQSEIVEGAIKTFELFHTVLCR